MSSRDKARDLTQGFFVLLLAHRDLAAVRREKGRFRSNLLTAFKHFMTDEWRRATALKRGKGQRPIPLEDLRAEGAIELEASDQLTPELSTSVAGRALFSSACSAG